VVFGIPNSKFKIQNSRNARVVDRLFAIDIMRVLAGVSSNGRTCGSGP
jgi:hypothetical protein